MSEEVTFPLIVAMVCLVMAGISLIFAPDKEKEPLATLALQGAIVVLLVGILLK